MFHRIQQTNPIQYELAQAGDGALYNPFLVTPPRIYRERIRLSNGIQGFYYDRNRDRYILVTWMDFAAWPSWRINAYEIHPETGLQTNRWLGLDGSTAFSWARGYEAGDLQKVYANRFAGSLSNTIIPVDPGTFLPDLDNPVVLSADVQDFQINQFLLNRTDGLVALSGTGHIRIYHYPSATLLARITMPELSIHDLTYESTERGWALLTNPTHGISAVKFNYQRFEVEAFTTLESNLNELNFALAYDNLRNTLAVFRQMPEDTDGGALHFLEMYKPISQPIGLTAPVPLASSDQEKVVKVMSNVVFSRGGMGRSVPVTYANDGEGTLLSRRVSCKPNGEAPVQYQFADKPDDDEITAGVFIPPPA